MSHPSTRMGAAVAAKLGPFLDEVVFVGGALRHYVRPEQQEKHDILARNEQVGVSASPGTMGASKMSITLTLGLPIYLGAFSLS